MPDRRASKQRLKSLSEIELRALVEAHERKIEALLAAPSRRLAGWLRSLVAPLSFGRLQRLQTFEDYVDKVDATLSKRDAAVRLRPRPAVPLPSDIPGFWRKASVPEAVDLIDRLLAAHDHRALFLLIDSPGIAAQEECEIARRYALTRLFDQQRIFSDAAAAAEELLGRANVRQSLGDRAFVAVVAARAHALARLGRLPEALKSVDDVLADAPAESGLHRLRAEIVWPRDPQAAIASLETGMSLGDPAAETRLLRLHLAARRDGFDHRLARTGEEEHFWEIGKELPRDFRLLFANAAGEAGDLAGQREQFDRFFALQGLEACIAAAWRPVEFGNLGNPDLPRASDGPLVSVIMTAFDAEATIAHSVQSVLDQTHRNFELLIVDDASRDGTVRVAEEMAARDGRIRILRNRQNCGTYVSKNRALAEARGEFFTFQDSDDWSHPERFARHVRFMSANPQWIASRSLLLRMNDEGGIVLKRWGARFAHLNPASAFCRIAVRDAIGFFDSVRVGADSEYWFRLRHRFGPAAAGVIPLILTIGLHHEKSLSHSGAGAINEEGYSPVRERYQREWLAWHRAQAETRDFYLPPSQPERRFPAPAEIAVGHAPEERAGEAGEPHHRGMPLPPPAVAPAESRAKEVVFGISLVARASVADWERVSLLLRATLRSVLGQSDPRLRILICGHDRPALPELDDPRVEFLLCDQPPPLEPKGFRRDKMRKRRLIAFRLRELGGGYLFPLDADDMVSRRVVEYVLSDDNRRGYSLTEGYVLDWRNRRLASVPGAWDATFDRVCGSSAILYFATRDLPDAARADSHSETYFDLFGEHAYWPVVAEECGRPLGKIPFPAGIYVVNHDHNLSFQLQRTALRQANITASIAAHSTPLTPALAAEFTFADEIIGG